MMSMSLSCSCVRLCPACDSPMYSDKMAERAYEAAMCGVGSLNALLSSGICPHCFTKNLDVDDLVTSWRRWRNASAMPSATISKSVGLPFDLV